MMFVIFEATAPAVLETLLMNVPESMGVLVFGIGLTGAAILTRWLLGRGDKEAEKAGKEA